MNGCTFSIFWNPHNNNINLVLFVISPSREWKNNLLFHGAEHKQTETFVTLATLVSKLIRLGMCMNTSACSILPYKYLTVLLHFFADLPPLGDISANKNFFYVCLP